MEVRAVEGRGGLLPLPPAGTIRPCQALAMAKLKSIPLKRTSKLEAHGHAKEEARHECPREAGGEAEGKVENC